MDILITISWLFILVLIVMSILWRGKIKGKFIWIILAFVVLLGVNVWYFLPYSVSIPQYDKATVRIYHGNAEVNLDDKSAELIEIIEQSRFNRTLYYNDIQKIEDDNNYYYLTCTLLEGSRGVYSNGFHIILSDDPADVAVHDKDGNRINDSSATEKFVTSSFD